MIDQLYLQLLGSFHIRFGERQIQEADWTLRKAQHLIKLLALAPQHRLHREQLIEYLWPDVSPDAAINSLRRTLYVARQTIGGADHLTLLRTYNGWITLAKEQSIYVDVKAFLETAAAAQQSKSLSACYHALSLYTGDLLPSDPYEEWTCIPRTKVETTYMNLLWAIVKGCEEQQDWEGAVVALHQLIGKDATDEDAHARLIQLYGRMGQRYQALRQFEVLETVLRQEFDIEPSPAVQSLISDIRAGLITPEPMDSPERRADTRVLTSLPHDVRSFVGRTEITEDLVALVGTTRILTLAGIGGMGKTRLALSVGQAMIPRMRDGVCFIELAELQDAELIPNIVATKCGLTIQSAKPVMDSIIAHLSNKELLLILDNCEHLQEACSRFINNLVRNLPNLHVLCTSRVALNVPGETIWRVPPLAVPDQRLNPTLDDLLACESVALFTERARAVNPQFTLSEHTAPFVARICQQVDGIPLAIELIAAWVDTLDVQELANRLGSRLQFALQSTRQHEHRTLESMINWTVQTLTPIEQRIFSRLAVFAQGWTLDAAEAICSDDEDSSEFVLNSLATLVRKSLVIVEQSSQGEVRYRLLEPIRQYALRSLEQQGEVARLQHRHAKYYESLVQAAHSPTRSGTQLEWLNRFDTELFNIRAALSWGIENPAEGYALKLCGGLWYYWYARASFAEGLRWLEAVLPPDEDAAAQDSAAAWRGYGIIHYQLGHYTTALHAFEQSRDYLQAINDQRGLARIYSNLGMVLIQTGKLALARDAIWQSLDLEQQFSPLRHRFIASTTHIRGELEFYSGRYMEAKECFRTAIILYREKESYVSLAESLHWLGEACLLMGEYPEARAHLEESLILARRHNCPQHIGLCLIKLGMIEMETGAFEVAEAAYVEAKHHFQRFQMEHKLPWVTYVLGILKLAQRDDEAARMLLNQAQEQFTTSRNVLFMARCHLAQGIVAASNGQQANALCHLHAIEPHLRDLPSILLGAAEVLAVLCLEQERWSDGAKVDALVDVARRQWNIPRLPSDRSWYEPMMIRLRQDHTSAYALHTIVSYDVLVDHVSTLLEEFREVVCY